MDEEQIEALIVDLRKMMAGMGFGWVAAEAEDTLFPSVAPRTRALALIAAAEGATVELAEVEQRALDVLGAEAIDFEPDEADEPDGDAALSRTTQPPDRDRLRGPQRRVRLAELAARRSAFDKLRRRLDGRD